MIPKVKPIISAVVMAIAGHPSTLPYPLNAAAGTGIEYAVGPIRKLGGVASALDLNIVDVFRIELRANIAGNICVRHRNTINCPGYLMPASDMELIMNHVTPGHKIGDH